MQGQSDNETILYVCFTNNRDIILFSNACLSIKVSFFSVLCPANNSNLDTFYFKIAIEYHYYCEYVRVRVRVNSGHVCLLLKSAFINSNRLRR